MNQSSNNLFIAVILSLIIAFSFQFFYAKPQQEAAHSAYLSQQVAKQEKGEHQAEAPKTVRPRAEVLKESARVTIATPELNGSINLKGALIDDLSLVKYREAQDPKSPAIVLLSPSGSEKPHTAYYAEVSWLSDASIPVPTPDTVWKTDDKQLTPDHSVKLSWDNGKGLRFERTIAVDADAMFTVTDRVTNSGAAAVTLYPFGLIARQGMPPEAGISVVHEGGLGVLDGSLQEYKYKKLLEGERIAKESKGGWLGITDKYWLMALIPAQDEHLTAEFYYNGAGATEPGMGFFQSDYRASARQVAAGASVEHTTHLFAGAKRVSLLDAYATRYNIPHFDKAIDFGWFYFLTRPFLYLLEWMATQVGGLGIAILLFTVLLKLATLPLSQKSYHSMSRMKMLQPEMQALQERFANDKMRQSQEMMELYKREKISPASGCVPTLIQIPIFFALYKVLYVNIEMRHAPFYGWIQDMSAADPTNLFNLFGAIQWTPPAVLTLGAWPLLMGISMFLQQKLSPQPADKSQARIFMFMPILFTFMLAHMPAGLVIYWTWSNLLGIVQQWYIMKNDEKRMAKINKAKAA